MNTLYVFGDSYADTFFEDHKAWPYLLADKINYKVKSFGHCGASLDYNFHHFNNIRKSLQKDDIVIFLLVNKERRWFFKDKPQVSGYWQNLEEMGCTTEESLAVEYFGKYLSETDISHTIDFFLHMFNELSNIIKPVVVFTEHDNYTCYKNQYNNILYFSDVLQDISLGELESIDELENAIARDPRSCHLCYSNHAILANNLLNLLYSNAYIKKTYLSRFLNLSKLSEETFRNSQLPNKIWVNK